MKWSSSKCALILAVAFVSALPLAAQKKNKDDAVTRSLQGLVTDMNNNPAVGAVVQLKDMRTLEIRSYITKDDGAYVFSGLKTDSDYQVKAEFNGDVSETKTLSVFDSRKKPTINLKVEKKSSPDRERTEDHP
ncbi:MAG TPA: carboxypeptidase-like regulatory domain-containing protein [Bryobacteraceae bacterium]